MQSVQFVIKATDEGASKALNNVADGAENLGKKSKATKQEVAAAGIAMSTAIVGIGASAVSTFAEFEGTMSGVEAVLKPTGDEMEALTDKARELGRTTQFSATESALGMEMLAKNGLDATTILNGAADSALALAAATGSDLATAADIATDAMASFNLGVDGLKGAVNGITGVTNVSKFSIQDYSLALAQGGGVAATVGVSFEDFNASIAAISPLFASGSDAGTSFKTMLLRLNPQSNEAYEAMYNLGLITEDGSNAFYDATGNMKSMSEVAGLLQNATKNLSDEEKNAYLNTIFGTDALRAAAGMAKVGSVEFDKLSEAIAGTDAAEIAAVRMDNLKGSFEQLSGAVEDIMISLGGALAPMVRGAAVVFTELANGISFLVELFDQMPAPVQNVVKILSGVAAGGLVVAGVAAFLTVSLGGVAAAFTAILVAAAPWIGLAAAIGIALYGLYEAWQNNFFGIQDITMSVFETVNGYIATVVQEWGPLIANAFTMIVGVLTTAWNTIIAVVTPIVTTLGTILSENWNSMKIVAEGVWGMISANFQLTFGTLIGIFKAFLQVLTGDWSGAWETIKSTAMAFWDALMGYFNGAFMVLQGMFGILWTAIQTGVEIFWGWMTGAMQLGWDVIVGIFQLTFDVIVGAFTLFWEGLMTGLELGVQAITIAFVLFAALFTGDWTTLTTAISGLWNGLWTGAATFASGMWTTIQTSAVTAWNSFKTAVGGVWTTIKDAAGNTWTDIKNNLVNTFNSIVTWFTGDGKSSMEGGFRGMIDGFVGIAKNVFNSVAGVIEGFVNIAVDAINRLIDASNAVNPFGSIPKVSRISVPRLAHGGFVEGPGGLDQVPAMLSPGELVLNAAQQQNVARGLQGASGGGGVTYNLYLSDNEFYGDSEEAAMKLGDRFITILKEHTSIPGF